jgi:hypothetical protein
VISQHASTGGKSRDGIADAFPLPLEEGPDEGAAFFILHSALFTCILLAAYYSAHRGPSVHRAKLHLPREKHLFAAALGLSRASDFQKPPFSPAQLGGRMNGARKNKRVAKCSIPNPGKTDLFAPTSRLHFAPKQANDFSHLDLARVFSS